MRRATFLLATFLLAALPAVAQPATPTSTPLAHPLAPNPHTSIGVFWYYMDANTGRRSTAVTYKVKRCSGASCTPTTVIASGLTNQDYQDTGLSVNTTYGYSYVATSGSDSGDSPVVYATTLAADSNMVQWPNTTWEKLLGPQVEAGSIPFTWYNSTATTNGALLISKYPVVGPALLKGTGSINNGSNILTGTNTHFLEQVAANNPTCLDGISIGGVSAGAIASVDSNTQITLASNWTGSNQSGVALSTNVPGMCGFGDPLNDYVTGNQLMYYDSPMALWQVYFRTGDPQYLRGAIQGSESVFAGYMWLGRNRAWNAYSTTTNEDNMPAPRNFQFCGYFLLGLAGHQGVWDLLDRYLNARYGTFVINRRGGVSDFAFSREKAYMVIFAAWWVMGAPDSFKRGDGTTTSVNGTTVVDGDLIDGRRDYYRDQLEIDIPGQFTTDQLPYGNWLETNAGGAWGENDMTPWGVAGTAQPFMNGLMGDGLGYCWRATELSSSVRNSARTVLLKSAANLGHRTYNTNIYSENTALRWRTIAYFDDGGHRLNPFAFLFGGDFAILNNTPDNNMMAQGRQAIPLMITTFGWAWEMTGHPWYKTQGDEMINAAFASTGENTIGSGADNVRTLCDATSNFKDYGQCYRSAARYFGHRLTTPSSLGTAPVVTMPGNVTLTGGVNQAELTASVACTNTPCVYKWTLKEYPQVRARNTARPTFFPDNALSTKLSGLESGPYKATFYTIDALGLEGHGEVTITAGDGQFPPTVWIGEGTSGAITSIYIFSTTSSSVTGAVRSCSIAGRTLSHSFSAKAPKDKSAPTISPSATTGGCGPNITFTVSGLSAGLWIVKDTVTDSAGLSRTAVLYIRHTAENQPSSAHNTIPDVAAQPDHVLPEGSTSTKLYVVPLDPEGIVGYPNSASGYTGGYDGAPPWLVTALTHSWSQQSGPTTATITNGSTLQPEITGLSAGVYVFRYSGTDQQGDVATTDITVTVQGDEPVEPTALKLMAICTSIIVAFYSVPLLLMLLQQRLDQRRRLRTIKLPRFITYQSVIGPDHRKQLRAHLDATFEPHLTTRRANASKQ